jgi:hypothetical protein
VGGSAWLLYYAPKTAYIKAKKARAGRPAEVEEMIAEVFRRLFLKPGADYYHSFVEELTKGGKLALMFEKETDSSYVFILYNMNESGGLKELGVRLRITMVGEGITYALEFDDVERWQKFFRPGLETAEKAAMEVRERLPVEDLFPYMLGWVNSDVAISRGLLEMSTSHLWQLAETHALFGWSYVTVSSVSLALEGPKPQFYAYTSLQRLDEAIKRSAEGGWLKMLGVKAESWEGLKQWVMENWDVVVDAAVRRLGEGVRSALEALRDRLNDDKIAREAVAPALLLIQAERLGVNETTLRYLGAVISGAVGGDGYVSAARKEVGLTSGEREIALLWAAALAAHGTEAKVRRVGGAFQVIVSGGDAARLAGLYFCYGSPLLEGDERIINHKLAEAVRLGAEGLDIRWEGVRQTKSGVAADLIISVGDVAVKYNVYLRRGEIELEFQSSDRGRVELAARLLRLAGVSAEVTKVGNRNVWRVVATTDMLAAGREELRKAIAELIKKARDDRLIDAGKAERWLKKLERGRVLMEGWPKYEVGLVEGALVVRYETTNLDSIVQEMQRFREMGLVKDEHFTVKMPEGGGAGYVNILKEGLAYAAWLSVHGSGEQRRLAAEFVEYILRRAEEADGGKCGEVCEKAEEIIEKGKAWGSLKLEGFEKKVEVGGKEHVVKVIGGGAEIEESRHGKKLLRIKITAEVGRVEGEHIVRVVREYTITYGRYGADNATLGYAMARANAPGGREADAERFSALIKALTGREPRIYRMKDGRIKIECYGGHLEGFMRYTELADVIKRWLEETSRR